MKDQIVGLERVQKKPVEGAKWNNHIVTWTIYHQNKNYEIELQMTYLSSKKIVRVNGDQRHLAMVTFGYESSFIVAEGLHGKIKQNGMKFQFELFINQLSFTELEKRRPRYQPLSISLHNNQALNQETQYRTKKNNQSTYLQSKHVEQISILKQPTLQNTFAKTSDIDKIKNTQKQLMKILKADKNKCKK